MKPLFIFRHIACDKAGFLCHYLLQREIPFELICISPGDRVSCDLSQTCGLIFLGAPSSVNTPEAWINDEIGLIQRAVDMHLPVMGACFGGQLIARALGAQVQTSEHIQIGWHPVDITQQGRVHLTGADLPDSFNVFEWHEEHFLLPEGAIPLFRDTYNHCQGFLQGKCFAMQFHLEMTEELITSSLSHFAHCLPPACESIQSSEQICAESESNLISMHRVAEGIYGWWLDQYVITGSR